jgi:hypothetical protein
MGLLSKASIAGASALVALGATPGWAQGTQGMGQNTVHSLKTPVKAGAKKNNETGRLVLSKDEQRALKKIEAALATKDYAGAAVSLQQTVKQRRVMRDTPFQRCNCGLPLKRTTRRFRTKP